MASKGMSTTLVIIVSAVVILVAALVLLTIFGGSMTPIASLTEAKNHCTLTNKQICETTGTVSPTWNLATINYEGVLSSCEDVCGMDAMAACRLIGEVYVFSCG